MEPRVSLLTGRGHAHYPPRVRVAVCEHFFLAYYHLYGKRLDDGKLPDLSRGCKGSAALTAAMESFEAVHAHHGPDQAQLQTMTRKKFYKILLKWFERWCSTKECKHKSRRKPINLNDAEWAELARLVSTPVQENGNLRRFKNLADAMEIPRVWELCDKARCLNHLQLLHEELLFKVPELHHGPEDRAARLCHSTLQKRRMLADKWVRAMPWFLLPRGPPRRSERLQRDGPASTHEEYMQPDDHREVFWRPEWMGQHCFMLDAVSFSDAEGPLQQQADHVYFNVLDVWGPKEEEPNKSPSEATTIMVYAVIHKYLGRIVGPDIMFTGSRLKNRKGDKELQFREAGIKTW